MKNTHLSHLEESILWLVNNTNEEVWNENSNKDARIAPTQRDLIAGEVSKDISMKYLLSPEVAEAHKNGTIHFHDLDYYVQKWMFNCCLVNIKDMLENGTSMNWKMVERPKSFQVACTILTQIIAAVASSQYGGQTINVKHLAVFLYETRLKFRKKLKEQFGDKLSDEMINEIAEQRLKEELSAGVQTIQYQINTLMGTNWQAPFVTLFLELDEKDPYIKETAMIIEEIFRQRITGIKNEAWIYITPAFPKLVYVLDEHNALKGGEYDYLTKIAVQCSAKRMYPDYISAKKMRENNQGNVFWPMWCVDGEEVVVIKYQWNIEVLSFKLFWEKFAKEVTIEKHENWEFIRLKDVEIYDRWNFVECKSIIRNTTKKWLRFTTSQWKTLKCTPDHPLPLVWKGRTFAEDIVIWDKLEGNTPLVVKEGKKQVDKDYAWYLWAFLCDGCYDEQFSAYFDIKGEDDIVEKFYQCACKFDKELTIKINKVYRWKLWNYNQIHGNWPTSSITMKRYTELFNGLQKIHRNLPVDFLEWNEEARYWLLWGIIDADGTINKKTGKVQAWTTNKKLALEMFYLIESLGYQCGVYLNHYNPQDKNKIRYRLEFVPDVKLLNYIVSEKKRAKFSERWTHPYKDFFEIRNIETFDLDEEEYSYDVTTASDRFDVSGLSSHNCRSFLSPYKDKNWNFKFEWRFNQGVVTLNLPQIWIETQGKPEEEFWKLLDERCELVFKALIERHNALKWTKAEYAPLLWQHWGLARLNKDDKIDDYLENGYSTISMWYIGVYETTYLVKKCSHTTEEGKAFALKLLKKLREKIDEWKAKTGIWFALYGTPAESLCYRFAKIDKERFWDIHNVTDKWYYTNSYHVDVREEIDAFSKLAFESDFQTISSWGAISYVEIPNMSKNLTALETLVKYIYDNIQYAEFNTKCDCCQSCSYEWEMLLDENNDWYCPNCWERDKHKMTVVRRTCFTKDNLVLTKDGYKNIDEVEIWDEVLTFKNRFKPVVEKREFENKELVKISSPAIDEIVCTPDHPFWVRSLVEPRKSDGRIKKLILSEPYIKKAKYLNENDYLLSLKNNREVDIDIEWLPTDKYEFWWVIGRILADGWVSKPYQRQDCKTISKVVWLCSGKHEVKTVQEKLNKLNWLFGKASEKETTFVWRSYNHDLYSFLKKIGSWAINKEIPTEWLDLPIEKARALLDGLLSWDGHIMKNGLYMIRSVSKKLVYWVKHLVAKIYWVNAKVYITRTAREETILWRKVNAHTIYDVKWFNIQPKGSQVFYKDWYLHSPVKEVEEFWKDKVYSLTVLDDASYTVNEVAVLNCGYLGSNYFNKWKTTEIKNRVLHI